jgi:flavin reductase (DIM6/NTAB) family NADH-FMN oxidoreductase RutF
MKKDFPISNVRRFLEPGPIVLVSSAYQGKQNIMTMGWYMILECEPSLIGCYIWKKNQSFQMVKKSKECIINIPTAALAATVVRIGNCSGKKVDKFSTFGLTPLPAKKVAAPLIKECFANFECRLVDTSQIKKYSLFIFEVVKAHVEAAPKFPKTLHYRGDGLFMISGPTTAKYRPLFKKTML